MKKFEAPVLEIVEGLTMEPVYAASGYIPTPEKDYTPAGGDWHIHCEYRGHNSGSHSEVAIIGSNHGSHSGECVTMHFHCSGIKLDYIKDNGGYSFFNVSEDGFSVTRPGHFNPNERFEFNIQIVAKDTQYHGAVGKSGEYTPCSIICTSYHAS